MGRLLGLLALLNVVVLAAGLSLESVNAKPAHLLDFNADKVRLLDRSEHPEAPAKIAEPTQAAAGQRLSRCLTWPALDSELFSAIAARMNSAGIEEADFDLTSSKRLGWWVYLPPFSDAAAMQAAIESAREKGVRDIAPVRSGDLLNAVSLGAFPTLAKAREQENRLRALGVQGLRTGPRPNSGSATLVIADRVPAAKLAALGEGWDQGQAPVACPAN